jgi:L-rhamnose mutarotase
MRRFGQTIRLKPEKTGEYLRHHAAVWPGVIKTIKQCHITNYSIFIKDHCLFAYFEYTGTDFEEDMTRMAADQETRKWWDVVKPLMEPLETRQEGEFWADMKEIFHLD